MPIELFVFDIAGTTVRDDGVVHRAFRETMDQAGLTAEDDWIKGRMGWNKVQVFREALRISGRPEGSAGELAAAFTGRVVACMDAEPPEPLPGAEAAIAGLRELGVRVAFNTGYSGGLAREIIRRVGWEPDAIVGSDEVVRGRPAPDLIREAMRRCGVVDPAAVGVAGDTPSDLAAGAAAGCGVVVGVGHGTHTLGELASSPHTHLMADLTGLAEVIGAAH
jgi:phosphonatase-like hydrolase